VSQAFATFRRANLEDRKPTTTTLLLASAALGAGCANWRPFGAEEMRGGMVTDWYLEPEMLARLCIALVFGLGVSLANAATLSISGG
jgi:hypothetical protein